MTDAKNPGFDARLKEWTEDQAVEVAKKTNEPGVVGAAYRLAQRLNHGLFVEWAADEARRGTTPQNIARALGSNVGMHVMQVAMMTAIPALTSGLTVAAVNDFCTQVLTGKIKAQGIEIDRDKGTIRETTAEGIMRERFKEHGGGGGHSISPRPMADTKRPRGCSHPAAISPAPHHEDEGAGNPQKIATARRDRNDHA